MKILGQEIWACQCAIVKTNLFPVISSNVYNIVRVHLRLVVFTVTNPIVHEVYEGVISDIDERHKIGDVW